VFLSFLMGLLIFLVTVSIIGYIVVLARKDVFQPIITAGVIFIVFYIFDIVYILFDEKETNRFPLSGSNFYYSNVYGISFVTIICIMMWFIGDFLANRKR